MERDEAKDMTYEQVFYNYCHQNMEKIRDDVGELKTKIFNGHSSAIVRLEREVASVKAMLKWLLGGVITMLLTAVGAILVKLIS